MLVSKDITKKFGSKTAVDAVSLSLDKGHVIAMLGPNGSGKTTWMKMAAGLVKPTSGTMFFEGSPIDIETRSHIAYMATEPYFYNWMTVADVGKYYADFFSDFSMDLYDEMLVRMDLTKGLKVKALSSGMMAKLKIAATMASKASVYLLDEPFNGIDLLARDEITRSILESAGPETLLLISSHLVEELEEVADQAVFIKDGRLVEMDDLETLRIEKGLSVADRYRQIYGQERGAAL